MLMLRRSVIASLALVLLGAVGARAQAPSDLRWKFKEGQVLRYVLNQNTSMGISVGGQSIDNSIDQMYELTWKVKAVKADGSAEMVQVFDRVKYMMDSVLGQMSVDTKDEKDPEGPAAAMGQVFRALVGAEATMVMTPLGEIKDFKLPAKAAEMLKNLPGMPGGQRMVSEDTFKEMVEQSTLVLPGKPLAANASWNTKRDVPRPPIGSMLVDSTYTFKGADPQNKALDKIDIKSAVELKVNPDSPFTVKIKKQDIQGGIVFNRDGGFLTNSKVEQKLDLEIEAMGQQIDQETKTTISITQREAGSK